MQPRLAEIWVYLSASPLAALAATLLAWQAAWMLHRASGFHPLVNPVAIAVALLLALLELTGTSYGAFFEGAQFVHFLLGPATVALAVPLWEQRARVRALWLPLAAALLVGVPVAAGSAIVVARWLGASRETLLSLAPKSVTTPVAMGIAERIGGLPSLTAALVIATGMLGAMVAAPLLDLLRVRDAAARGFAMGVAAHGIGTARAFQVDEQNGAFAGLAMGLSALLAALALPPLARWLVG